MTPRLAAPSSRMSCMGLFVRPRLTHHLFVNASNGGAHLREPLTLDRTFIHRHINCLEFLLAIQKWQTILQGTYLLIVTGNVTVDH